MESTELDLLHTQNSYAEALDVLEKAVALSRGAIPAAEYSIADERVPNELKLCRRVEQAKGEPSKRWYWHNLVWTDRGRANGRMEQLYESHLEYMTFDEAWDYLSPYPPMPTAPFPCAS